MTLYFYFARHLARAFLGVFGFLFVLAWLPNVLDALSLDLNAQGAILSLWDKIGISFSYSLAQTLDLVSIAMMIASLLSLTLLGRNAELHIVRGAGLRPLHLLAIYASCAAVLTALIHLLVTPIALELSKWSDGRLDEDTKQSTTLYPEQRIAWAVLDNGEFQIRLEAYDATNGTAHAGLLMAGEPSAVEGDPINVFAVEDVRIDGMTLTATRINQERGTELVSFSLDHQPQSIAASQSAYVRSLPHMLGWVGKASALSVGLSDRQFVLALNLELAAPFASAALVLLAGTMCVNVGTRQALGSLIFGALTLVVIAYCLVVVSQAFGSNGKLCPLVAAWGPPSVLASSALAILFWQELSWIFGAFRRKQS